MRVGVLLDNGDLLVKDGIEDGEWTTLDTDVRRFQLAGDFIGVLRENGSFRVKEGINGAWTAAVDGVKEFEMRKGIGPLASAAMRVGVVTDSGDLLVNRVYWELDQCGLGRAADAAAGELYWCRV